MAVLKWLDADIASLTTDDAEVVRELEEADAYCQSMYKRLIKLDTCLKEQVCGSSSSVPASGGSSSSNHARLPTLDLPLFSGDLTE